MKEIIKSYVQGHRKEIVDMVKSLAAIPSVRGERVGSATFGSGCLEALNSIESLYESEGYKTEREAENHFVTATSDGDDKLIGIFTHADVVPVNESDWIYTKPFEPIEKDGFLIGRGVHDNKSGVVGAIWAMKALKEHGLLPKSRVMLFAGSDEESGMSDVSLYAKTREMPDFSIIPDNAYPVCRGEKTIENFFVTFRKPFVDILDFSGGSAFNIALDRVDVLVKDKDGLFEELEELIRNEKDCVLSKNDDAILLTAHGKSAHASTPKNAVNAALIAINVLIKSSISESDKEILKNAKSLLDDPYYKGIGLDTTDSEFGITTVVNGIVLLEEGRLKLSFDCRYGSEIDGERLIADYKEYFNKIGADYSLKYALKGYSIPENDPAIIAIMEAWQSVTGDKDKKPYLSLGGTYARFLKNAVSTGSVTSVTKPLDLPSGHGEVHQPDETLDVEGFLHAIELLAHMIIKVDEVLHTNGKV